MTELVCQVFNVVAPLVLVALGSLWFCRWLAEAETRRLRRSRKKNGERRLKW